MVPAVEKKNFSLQSQFLRLDWIDLFIGGEQKGWDQREGRGAKEIEAQAHNQAEKAYEQASE
jgi:hypothetical protein